MSGWLERALASIGCPPTPVLKPNVSNVPNVPKGARRMPDTGTIGTFGTIGTADVHFDRDREESVGSESFDERAAIIEYEAGAPREWAEGFATLNVSTRPPGFSGERWRQLVDDAGHFIDRWGHRAAALGWRVEQVFGIDPAEPLTGYAGMGLVVLIRGGCVERIDECTATIRHQNGAVLVYLRRSRVESVPIWKLISGSFRTDASNV